MPLKSISENRSPPAARTESPITSPLFSICYCLPDRTQKHGWLNPRVSYSDDGKVTAAKVNPKQKPKSPAVEVLDLEVSVGDFEFPQEDPVGMLPADELFSDGKLVPLQISSLRAPVGGGASVCAADSRREAVAVGVDPYLFSPKAPRCSSRWMELLGLKKQAASQRIGESVKTPSFWREWT